MKKSGGKIQWVFEGTASQLLRDALDAAGLPILVGLGGGLTPECPHVVVTTVVGRREKGLMVRLVNARRSHGDMDERFARMKARVAEYEAGPRAQMPILHIPPSSDARALL